MIIGLFHEVAGRGALRVARLVVVLSLLCVACGSTVRMPSVQSAQPVGPGTRRAGVSRVDITPPPGLALFGHGPEGRVSVGHRGRLLCRSLVVIDARGESIAWVVCDLQAPATLLQRRIAERVVAKTGIGADRLILSATHTHGGPGHFFGTNSYSGPLTSERPGFDINVVEWLADRIAAGVLNAHEAALKGGPVALAWQHGTLSEHLSRNRSMDPHCANADPMPGAISTCSGVRNPYREVDKRLSVLRIDRLGAAGAAPLAVFGVVAMHPTAVPNTNDVYHADLFGIASRLAELSFGNDTVVAIANGLEGDVSPAWRQQSWSEALRIGRALGSEVVSVARSAAPSADFSVQRAYLEVELFGGQGKSGPKLCPTGEVGNSAAGGAEDGRTRFWAIPSAREGTPKLDRCGCHNPRRAWTRGLTDDEWAFPTFTPIHAVALGNALLLTLPGEMTTTPGLKLRNRLEKESQTKIVIVGLSNGYVQYLTSAKEYAAQHYEGASMIYGPQSSPFFEERSSEIVAALRGGTELPGLNSVLERELRPSPTARRLVSSVVANPTRRLLQEPFEVPGSRQVWAVEWEAPDGESDPTADPLVRVEIFEASWVAARDPDGDSIDDRSSALWIKKRREFSTRWVAAWAVPEGIRKGDYRFVIGRGTRALVSTHFGVSP